MTESDVCSVDNMYVFVRQEYLASLIAAYNMFAADSCDRFLSRDLTPREMSDEHFEGDAGYWWCRHMVRDGVFCIANVTVPESIRGQGVFGEFLDYVISNPHYFTGVEVESLDRDGRLIEYLNERDFVETHVNIWGRPTVRYMLKED